MFAQITLELKNPIAKQNLLTSLNQKYPSAGVAALPFLTNLNLTSYQSMCVAVYSRPGVDLVFLLTQPDEIYVYVMGNTVREIKSHCQKLISNFKTIAGAKMKDAQVRIFFKGAQFDIPVLKGERVGYFKPFWLALVDKWISKMLAALVTGGGALWYALFASQAATTVSTTPAVSGISPIATAIVGIVATAVSVFAEAIHAAWRADAWKWSETE